MKRGLAVVSVVVACLAAQASRAEPPPPAGAGDVEEARRHYARGVELYEQGADASALAELERAYQLAPNWKVLYELGVVELAVHDFAAALRYFEQYLAEGKDGVRAVRKQEVTDHVAKLRQQVATLELVTAAGAEIKLDDVAVGTAPLAKPLVVNPGHHKLGASKDGLAAESRAISVAGGDHTRVEIVIPVPAPPSLPLAPAIPEPVPPAPVTNSSPHGREEVSAPPPSPFPLWIGWIATGALASGALVTGLEALSANGGLTRAKTDGPSDAATLRSLSSRAHAFAIASDAMTGAAAVAGGVTLYFTLRSPPRPALSASSVSLEVGVGRVSVEGRF